MSTNPFLLFISSFLQPTYSQISSSREVLSVLVEADGHDSVRGIEGLLHAVPVMDVDIDVQDTLVIFEQLQDGENDVVDIAESTGLRLLSVVESASPVDGDVSRLLVQFDGGSHGPASRELAKLVEAIENRTILQGKEEEKKILSNCCVSMSVSMCTSFVQFVWANFYPERLLQ